jgi:hypothetical protein
MLSGDAWEAPSGYAKNFQTKSRRSKMDKHFNGTRADDLQVSGNHYKEMPIQPWAVMESVLTREEFRGFLRGNVIKYSMRAGRKEGSDDAGKAKHYIMKLKEFNEKMRHMRG